MSTLNAASDISPTVPATDDSGGDRRSDMINLNHLNRPSEPATSPLIPSADSTPITTTTMPSSEKTTTTTMPSSATATSASATGPTPASSGRFSAKRPTNLNLKISTTRFMANSEESTTTTTTTTTTSNTSSATPATSVTMFPHEQLQTIKRLDIGFDDVGFSAKTGFLKKGNKEILRGLSGEFRSGELSAIVGPSGAGKSTLLNILSGYLTIGYSGRVTVNGNTRDLKAFKPNVAFITQDTSLQPFLTVKEAMHFSANLKIGLHMTKSARRERVRKILEAIGMYENRHTRTGSLSGGQKKRLAIALELVNNPPVLILDEPTTGLDSFTSNQCISLLKKLALEGRTVICTIHQPSALAFETFDHLYAIAEGRCIYAGGTHNLVPFLADVGLECPESYNPADYLLEIATDDYGRQNPKLVEKIENGRNNSFRQNHAAKKAQLEAMRKIDKMMAAGLMTPVTAPLLSPGIGRDATPSGNNAYQFRPLTPIHEMSSRIWDSCGVLSNGNGNGSPPNTKDSLGNSSKVKPKEPAAEKKPRPSKPNMSLDPARLCKRENIYATPFYRQLGILLVRTFLILWRDKSLTTMRFVIHLVTALLIGCLYYGIGDDAGNALNNFRYVFYTIMFIMYCAFSSILVKFPLEFPIVSREHFNRWYSLRAYYVAITLADIPIQLICTSLFIGTTYVMTGQPWELFRLAMFSLMVFLTALVGQSIGLAVGSSLSMQLGAILGPFFICPFLTFSGFFLQLKDAPVYLHWLFHTSFLKYSLDGSMLAIFGYDRPKLQCSSMYCHYSHPHIFLKDLDMVDASYEFSVLFLFAVFILLRILAFYIMSFRLRLFR